MPLPNDTTKIDSATTDSTNATQQDPIPVPVPFVQQPLVSTGLKVYGNIGIVIICMLAPIVLHWGAQDFVFYT